MKVVLRISILCKVGRHHWGEARREIADVHFTPSPDIEFQHAALPEARRPEHIAYDIEEDAFWVYLGVEEHGTKEECQDRAAQYRGLDWTVRGDDQ